MSGVSFSVRSHDSHTFTSAQVLSSTCRDLVRKCLQVSNTCGPTCRTPAEHGPVQPSATELRRTSSVFSPSPARRRRDSSLGETTPVWETSLTQRDSTRRHHPRNGAFSAAPSLPLVPSPLQYVRRRNSVQVDQPTTWEGEPPPA